MLLVLFLWVSNPWPSPWKPVLLLIRPPWAATNQITFIRLNKPFPVSSNVVLFGVLFVNIIYSLNKVFCWRQALLTPFCGDDGRGWDAYSWDCCFTSRQHLKVLSGRVPTCHCAHSWQLYSAASLGHQAASTMTCYLTQLHYPDTESTSPFPIIIMLSTRLGSDKYQFYSHRFDSDQTPDSYPRSSDSLISQGIWEVGTLLI